MDGLPYVDDAALIRFPQPESGTWLSLTLQRLLTMHIFRSCSYISAVDRVTLHEITSHQITLHYITLHYITLHYITLHYIELLNPGRFISRTTAE